MANVMDMCSGEWGDGPSSESEVDSQPPRAEWSPEPAGLRQYAATQLITQNPTRKLMPIELAEVGIDAFFLKMDKYFD